MLKAKKIRLDVSEQDAATLEMMQGKCRGLYNWWVMVRTVCLKPMAPLEDKHWH